MSVELRTASSLSTDGPPSSSMSKDDNNARNAKFVQSLCKSYSTTLLIVVVAGLYNGHYGTTYFWLALLFFWSKKLSRGFETTFDMNLTSVDGRRLSTERHRCANDMIEKGVILLRCFNIVLFGLAVCVVSICVFTAFFSAKRRTGHFVEWIAVLMCIIIAAYKKIVEDEVQALRLQVSSLALARDTSDEEEQDLRPRSTRLDNMIHCHEMPCNRYARFCCSCTKVLCKTPSLWLLIFLTASSSLTILINCLSLAHFTPPGELFDIGDGDFSLLWTKRMYQQRFMHLYCEGEIVDGSPVIWLEHGWLGSSLDWQVVRPILSSQTRVCSYDRAGYGWSEPGPLPRTSEQLMRETEYLIDSAGEYIWRNSTKREPMVLAGHSMAGFNMRIFTQRNPDLVKAIYFADPVNPDFVLYPKFGGRYRNNPIYNFGSFFLAPTGIQWWVMKFEHIMDTRSRFFRPQYASLLSNSNWFETGQDEFACWPEDSARTNDPASGGGSLGDLPIKVVAAKYGLPYNETLLVANISSRGEAVIVEDGHHYIFKEAFAQQIADDIMSFVKM